MTEPTESGSTLSTPDDRPPVPGAAEPTNRTARNDRARNRLGGWALALGIAGLVFAVIPHVSGFGLFLGVIALVLAFFGWLRTRRIRAGAVVGLIAVVLGAVLTPAYASGSHPRTVDAVARPASTHTSSASAPAPRRTSEPTTAPSKVSTPQAPAAPAGSASELQALTAAEGYLSDGQGFSESGLLNQLDSSAGNGFAQPDAQWAIDHSDADWNAQALEAAKSYLTTGQGFSEAGLTAQLTSADGSGFTAPQAAYAVANSGADWNAQAVQAAKSYVASGIGFSRASMIDQLTSADGSQFTEAQAEYAATAVGLN